MKNEIKRVLLVSKAYPPVIGGVETYSEAVVRAYLRESWSPTVLTQTEGSFGWQTLKYPEGEVRLFNLGTGGENVSLRLKDQPKIFLRMIFALRSILSSHDYGFIHATTWRSALAVMLVSSIKPLAITIHGREVLNYPFFLKGLMRRALCKAKVVVTVSKATMEIARQALGESVPEGTWAVAFNGISYPDEARRFERQPSEKDMPLRLLSLSRLAPRKNIQGCIAALSEIYREGIDNFEYWIGGKGPLLEVLKRQVIDSGLEGKVKFIGYVQDKDLPALYQSADAFLHPQTNVGEGNDFEGFGLVIADAMSFGCAVLAGKDGGPKDFISHMQNGLLVDGLNGSALKQAIRSLLTDAELRERVSLNGRDFSLRSLSWDEHVKIILSGIN